MYNTFQTLPPISKLSPDEEKFEKDIRKRKENELWEKPEPPVPFLLHLGLTARTHDIKDYQQNFPDDYKKYYVDRLEEIFLLLLRLTLCQKHLGLYSPTIV